MTSIDIRLKRPSKIYHEGELITGVVVIQSKGESSHNGLMLTVDGSVNLQLSPKSVGMFEAFYNSIKPVQLLSYSVELAKPGRFPSGSTEIPFELPLRPKANRQFYETYHGVFVNIQYVIRVDMKRSLLSKDLQKQCEFVVEYKEAGEKVKANKLPFTISPDTLHSVKEKVHIPKFDIQGSLDSTTCSITEPFTGEVTVKSSDVAIKSIELQLIRVETCGCAEGYARDEFEVNIVVVFVDDHLVSENFPIKLTR